MWILYFLLNNLILVLILEVFLGILFGARSMPKILTVILVNIITNPFVVLAMLTVTMFFPPLEVPGIIVLETSAVIIEGFVYSKYKTFQDKNAYSISLMLNFASFMAGEILNIIL